MKHICETADNCICDTLALDPDEDCPMHGHPFPPRCLCGRYTSHYVNLAAIAMAGGEPSL